MFPIKFHICLGASFLPSDTKIENIFDLNGKTVGVLKEGVNGIRFISQCKQFEINCNIIEFNSYEEIFEKVASLENGAGVSNNLVGGIYLNQYNMISSAIVFNPFKVYVSVHKRTNQNLLKIFDKYITQWKNNNNSFYSKTRLKWLLPKVEDKLPILIMYLIAGLLQYLQ